jgi:hypothetical protein
MRDYRVPILVNGYEQVVDLKIATLASGTGSSLPQGWPEGRAPING